MHGHTIVKLTVIPFLIASWANEILQIMLTVPHAKFLPAECQHGDTVCTI
jgi:hypothetical protein